MIRGQMFSAVGEFVLAIASNVAGLDLRKLALAAGWTPAQRLVVNITANYVAGLSVLAGQSFPNGIRIHIAPGSFVVGYGSSSAQGTTAFTVRQAVTVDNQGAIIGGGGAGGRGGGATAGGMTALGGVGGGGQGLITGGVIAGPYDGAMGQSAADGGFPTSYQVQGGRGGAGGPLGHAGYVGEDGRVLVGSGTAYPGSAGYPPGLAVDGYSYVTWINEGVLTGGVNG